MILILKVIIGHWLIVMVIIYHYQMVASPEVTFENSPQEVELVIKK